MSERSNSADPIPDEFASIDEAVAFWDTHDFGEYWDETVEVDLEVRAPRHR